MEALKIPPEYVEKFKFYSGLSTEIKLQFIEEMKNLEIGLKPPSLVEYLSTKFPISQEKLEDIVMMLFNLTNAQKRLKLNNEEFVTILERTFAEIKDLPFSLDKMLSDLSQLLSASEKYSFTTAKIVDSMIDNPKIFIDSSLHNDIRPVFLDEGDDLLGMVVIYRLKIAYRENDNEKEIHFSLDDDDLKKLKDLIERTEKQTKKLKSLSSIKFIEVK